MILRWTPQTGDDLQAIYDFIARDSPHYAQLTIEEILGVVDRLIQFPLMGRVVPEHRRDDLRELIKPAYRIVYRVGDAVYVLTVFRASRFFPHIESS